MPKGGDLHNHLSGAAYAETLIDAGAASGVCVDPARSAVAPCGPATRKMADAVHDSDFRRALVDAWSMRGFVPSSGISGHDHFFSAFAKFGGAASVGDMAADVVNRAGAQHMRYLELMVTFQGRAVTDMARKLPWTGDMAAARGYATRALRHGPSPAATIALAMADLEDKQFETARERLAPLLTGPGLTPVNLSIALGLDGDALDMLDRPMEAFAAYVAARETLREPLAALLKDKESAVDRVRRHAAFARATPGRGRRAVTTMGRPPEGARVMPRRTMRTRPPASRASTRGSSAARTIFIP